MVDRLGRRVLRKAGYTICCSKHRIRSMHQDHPALRLPQVSATVWAPFCSCRSQRLWPPLQSLRQAGLASQQTSTPQRRYAGVCMRKLRQTETHTGHSNACRAVLSELSISVASSITEFRHCSRVIAQGSLSPQNTAVNRLSAVYTTGCSIDVSHLRQCGSRQVRLETRAASRSCGLYITVFLVRRRHDIQGDRTHWYVPSALRSLFHCFHTAFFDIRCMLRCVLS